MMKPLYKFSNSQNKVYQFTVTVDGAVVTVSNGIHGGKMVDTITTCKGKNKGKSNETTDEQQAIKEAKSKWDKKVKEGYVEDESGLSNLKLPQKIKVYQDNKHKIEFPCLISPKLNGVNGEYRLKDGELILYSRGGEVYPDIPHLTRPILRVMDLVGVDSLNGEMYLPNTHLQDIQSAVAKPNWLSRYLEFHIFDFPTIDMGYNDKYKHVTSLWKRMASGNKDFVKLISAELASTHENIEGYHEELVKNGAEGIVIRNLNHKYNYNERSNSAFKYKIALDGEYQVKGFTIDKSGHPVFVCHVDEDKQFKVKLKGTKEDRLAMTKIADTLVGKWLKIEFESLSKDGIPTKPVGIMFRECDENGEPLQ